MMRTFRLINPVIKMKFYMMLALITSAAHGGAVFNLTHELNKPSSSQGAVMLYSSSTMPHRASFDVSIRSLIKQWIFTHNALGGLARSGTISASQHEAAAPCWRWDFSHRPHRHTEGTSLLAAGRWLQRMGETHRAPIHEQSACASPLHRWTFNSLSQFCTAAGLSFLAHRACFRTCDHRPIGPLGACRRDLLRGRGGGSI